MTITTEQAYRKGWDASRRTTTCDLEAAERRFLTRYGEACHDDFVRGWCDYAADKDYNPEPTSHREHDPVGDEEGSMDVLGVHVVVASCLDQGIISEVCRDRYTAQGRARQLERRALVTAVRIIEA